MGFPMVSYTRFVQYHQENVAKGNLWKYGENNERTVAHESMNILCVLYKIFQNVLTKSTMLYVTNLITRVTYCKDILSKKNQYKINKKYSMKFGKVSCKARNVFIQVYYTFMDHFMTCNVAQENSKSRKYYLSS